MADMNISRQHDSVEEDLSFYRAGEPLATTDRAGQLRLPRPEKTPAPSAEQMDEETQLILLSQKVTGLGV
jgi:hypothetical protein